MSWGERYMSGLPSCADATSAENRATLIYGTPIKVFLAAGRFLRRHPKTTIILLGPVVLLEKVWPKRNPCDRMPR